MNLTSRCITRGLGLALLVAATVGLPVSAGDGATPLWEPTTISTPGSYVLTRDIVSAVNPVLTITASNVQLDLNGFRIEGDADIFAADVVLVSGVSGTVIENGAVVGGGAAIRLSTNSTQFVLRDLILRGGRTGIGVSSNSARGRIERVVVQATSDNGISISGTAMQVQNNVINSAINGIVVENCASCQVSGNTVRGASVSAISVNQGSGNLIFRNTISGATTGLRISQGGYHVVDGNVLSGNTSYGLHLRNTSFENVYRANVARNNGGGACPGTGNADYCDEGAGNTSAGDNFLPGVQ